MGHVNCGSLGILQELVSTRRKTFPKTSPDCSMGKSSAEMKLLGGVSGAPRSSGSYVSAQKEFSERR